MHDLETLSLALKKDVGKYNPDLFIQIITTYIKGIAGDRYDRALYGLVSPLRQLLYLGNLNLTSSPDAVTKDILSDGDWSDIKNQLRSLDIIYDQDYGESYAIEASQTDEQLKKRAISLSTYNAFFHQGPLKFEEQIIEKIERVFKDLSADIEKEVHITPFDFLAIYEQLDTLAFNKLNRPFQKKRDGETLKLDQVKEDIRGGKVSFLEGMRSIAQDDLNEIMPLSNPGSTHLFDIAELYAVREKDKVDLFIKTFTSERIDNPKFLFFSNKSALLEKPIFKFASGKYIVIDYKLLLDAIYTYFHKTALNSVNDKNRIPKARNKYLEEKTTELFRDFLAPIKNVKYFANYYVNDSEHDLLVLFNKTALIIEAKAGNVREPFFDAEKGYDRIKKDFDNTIDYGYEQTFKIRQYFIDKEPMTIRDANHNVVEVIETKYYKDVQAIIVTSDKFGHIQSDLNIMIELYEDDVFPWSVCIDDLEVFLLSLKKKNYSVNDFLLFLNLRRSLHGKLNTNDEGRILGHFLNHKNFFKMRNNNGIYQPAVTDDIIFDELYKRVLGFKNEKLVAEKSNPKFWDVI
jgi:hypothetical protein